MNHQVLSQLGTPAKKTLTEQPTEGEKRAENNAGNSSQQLDKFREPYLSSSRASKRRRSKATARVSPWGSRGKSILHGFVSTEVSRGRASGIARITSQQQEWKRRRSSEGTSGVWKFSLQWWEMRGKVKKIGSEKIFVFSFVSERQKGKIFWCEDLPLKRSPKIKSTLLPDTEYNSLPKARHVSRNPRLRRTLRVGAFIENMCTNTTSLFSRYFAAHSVLQ